jgi:hypothetical protein
MSQEDFLARWIAREWPEGRFRLFSGLVGDEASERYHWGGRSGDNRHAAFPMKVSGVCRVCNNGWMSSLETLARPTLRSLIRGNASSVTPSDRIVLSRWFYKTVMAWEFFHLRDFPPFFTSSERLSFHRPPHSLPDGGLIMSLAHYGGSQDAWLLEGELPVALRDGGASGRGRCLTLSIGRVALQLFAMKWSSPVRGRLGVTVQGRWSDFGCELWPQVFTNSHWPPGQSLDDEGMVAFANRWQTLA